jgi:tetratricopeptide (TPR) repeat protein
MCKLMFCGVVFCTPAWSTRSTGAQPEIVREALAEVERLGTVEGQLHFATLQKRRIRGTAGEARQVARRQAVQAYRAVREYFPRSGKCVSEASFRAGELLRSSGQLEGAQSEFQHAERHGQGSLFRARAGLELGHLHRRALRLNDALECFERVEGLGRKFAEQRDLAAYWQGKVHVLRGRLLDAQRCYKRAALKGVDALRQVRAFDVWMDVLVEQGELEGAAGVLELCRQSLREKALEKSTQGTRVRAALDSMRSPGRLARAVAERHRRRKG